ncbi:hypothetical protein ACHAW6_015067 [Cyclotella cf. meneghiniana]
MGQHCPPNTGRRQQCTLCISLNDKGIAPSRKHPTKHDLSRLQLFGAWVCVKVMGHRQAKLNRHNFSGIFLGYTATDDNIRYIDIHSGVVKTLHHVVFNKA